MDKNLLKKKSHEGADIKGEAHTHGCKGLSEEEKYVKLESIKKLINLGKYNSNEVLDDLANTISKTLFKNL